jgi:hypothetical protein
MSVPSQTPELPGSVVVTSSALLGWLTQTKFAGYTRFQLLPSGEQIHCVSGLLDGTGDHFIGVSYAERAMVENWTWEQAEANRALQSNEKGQR